MASAYDEAAFEIAIAALESLTDAELEKVRAEAGKLRMELHEEKRKADSDRINDWIKEKIATADVDIRDLIMSTGIGLDSILVRGEVLEIMFAVQGFTIRPLGVDMFAGRVCQIVYPNGEFGSSNVSVDPLNPDFGPYLPYIRLGQHLWREGIKDLIPSRSDIIPLGMYPGEETVLASQRNPRAAAE